MLIRSFVIAVRSGCNAFLAPIFHFSKRRSSEPNRRTALKSHFTHRCRVWGGGWHSPLLSRCLWTPLPPLMSPILVNLRIDKWDNVHHVNALNVKSSSNSHKFSTRACRCGLIKSLINLPATNFIQFRLDSKFTIKKKITNAVAQEFKISKMNAANNLNCVFLFSFQDVNKNLVEIVLFR